VIDPRDGAQHIGALRHLRQNSHETPWGSAPWPLHFFAFLAMGGSVCITCAFTAQAGSRNSGVGKARASTVMSHMSEQKTNLKQQLAHLSRAVDDLSDIVARQEGEISRPDLPRPDVNGTKQPTRNGRWRVGDDGRSAATALLSVSSYVPSLDRH
jgi:hypothetical protein